MEPINPAPVLELIDAFRQSKAMFAAVSLGVFDALHENGFSSTVLAAKLGVNREALERLLDACVSLQLLRRSGSFYENEAIAREYLSQSSPASLAGYILYSNDVLLRLWSQLEDAVREGSPRWKQVFGSNAPIFDQFFRSDESKEVFLSGMHGFGLLSSPKVVEAFDLSAFRRFVDLGGGTGHLAVAACSRYPNLHACVFDLPTASTVADSYISKAGISRQRIRILSGDFFRDDLPEADLFALGRILHDWSAEKIARLLDRVFDRLHSGGAILIAEKLLTDDKTGPLPAQLQSLNMLVCTEGKERSLLEYKEVLELAGFCRVEGRITGAPLDAVLAWKP